MIDINEKYCIGNNNYNIILYTKSVAQSGKKEGEVIFSPVGYYTSYENLYKGLLRMEQINSVSLSDLKKAVEDIKLISEDTEKAIQRCLRLK